MKQTKAKKEKTGKKISGKLHLWLGLASSLVVFIVSITGCLFVFEKEIRDFTQKEIRFVTPVTGASFVALDKVEQHIKAAYPAATIKQLRLYSEPNRAWQVHFDKDEAVAINPYTGSIIKKYSRHDWLHTVEKLHTSLLLGETGKWIIRINVLIFLVLLISGIILWWPGNKARRKQSFKVKWDASAKRVNYDFHNVFGFYSSVILLLIVLTGMYMSFDWMKQATYAVTGSAYVKPKPPKIDADDLNDAILQPAVAYAIAAKHYPGATEVHINYPQKPGDVLKIKMHYPSSTYKKTNELHFNPNTGNIMQANLYANYSAGDKVKHSNRDLHTGAFFGLFGKILAFLASLVAASMPVTGFAIWWGRNKKKKPAVKKTASAKATGLLQPAAISAASA
ncbi:MAG TPA: PepSY-associated TM helix domain-containing protein [Ferruginibacter sp.]|nr:PepSY-associated TM helix domain-containing protein [Ferruginibacter sp.]HMP19712.1 PepSY-associated TM helix domain-containing protein [Ferruginibacter sp.]